MTLILTTPYDMAEKLAKKLKSKRLSLNLTQKTLALNSGVSLSVLKKYEKTGKISLESLLKLALVLESLDDFNDLFNLKDPLEYNSLEELLKEPTNRKRGRK